MRADAYGGYGKLYDARRAPGPVTEAACWSHARRKFFVLADIEANARRKWQAKAPTVVSPMALEAVQRIDSLFEIERSINGLDAKARKTTRQEVSAPLVAALETWMREERAKLSRHNDVARAMDYMLKRWESFMRLLDDGKLPIEQRRRKSPAWNRPRKKVVVVRGFGSRRRAGGGRIV